MPKRRCKFTDELQSKYPCFRAGRVEWEAECMTCTPGTYISIANKGSGDLEIHMNSEKHFRNFRGETSSEKLTKCFVKSNSKLDESVCAAEGTVAFRTVAHHNSFKSMDCTSKLLGEMFNDSEVAKRISSGHTKTGAIVNSVLAPHAVQEVINSLQDIPFCGVSTDASNHGAVKIFPILIQYFDYENGGLQTAQSLLFLFSLA